MLSLDAIVSVAEFMIKIIAEKHKKYGVGQVVWSEIIDEFELTYPYEYTDEMIDYAIELITEAAEKHEKKIAQEMASEYEIPPGTTIH